MKTMLEKVYNHEVKLLHKGHHKAYARRPRAWSLGTKTFAGNANGSYVSDINVNHNVSPAHKQSMLTEAAHFVPKWRHSGITGPTLLRYACLARTHGTRTTPPMSLWVPVPVVYGDPAVESSSRSAASGSRGTSSRVWSCARLRSVYLFRTSFGSNQPVSMEDGDRAPSSLEAMRMRGGPNTIMDPGRPAEMDPTEKEIRNYAVWIGLVPEGTMDALTEEDRALACEGLRAGLPPGWRMCETDARAIYYINSDSKSYSWDHPADRHYRALVSQRRAKRSQGGQLSEAEKNAALAALHIVEAPQRSALEKKWEELSEAEKNAAIQLGWEADGTDWPSGEAGERWDGYASMSAMTKEQQDHWATLGFGVNAWDAWIGECPSKARPRWGNQHSGHLTHQNEARDSGQAPRHAEGATNAQLYILRYKPRIEEVIYRSLVGLGSLWASWKFSIGALWASWRRGDAAAAVSRDSARPSDGHPPA